MLSGPLGLRGKQHTAPYQALPHIRAYGLATSTGGPMATTFSVHLFGKLALQRDAQPLHPLDTRKAQELFCYLLLYRDRAHPREALASVLWGDIATAQSKTY